MRTRDFRRSLVPAQPPQVVSGSRTLQNMLARIMSTPTVWRPPPTEPSSANPFNLRIPKEYLLLYELSVNAGRVVTHDELLRKIWGAKKPDDLRALRTHLRRIRSHFGEDASNPHLLLAEPSVGYRVPKGEGDRERER